MNSFDPGDSTTYIVTSIGSNAFIGSTALVSIDMSSCTSLTSIGYYTFRRCRSLVSVTFPSSITSIEAGAFLECNHLTSINLSSTSINSIEAGAFLECNHLTSINLSSTSINSIGDGVFYQCTSLASINLSSTSINSIGDSVFYQCTSLTSLDLSSTSLTSIGNYTFTICSNLTSITFPSTLTSIGDYTFLNCSSLISITFYNTVSTPTIGSDTFTDIANPSTAYYLYGTNISSIQSPPLFTYYIELSPPPPCFLIGTNILTDKGYIPIEQLRKGDLIKSYKHGFLKVEILGKGTIYNSGKEERIKDRLYRCSKDQYPELTEDLVLTGCHSLLIDDFINEEQRKKTIEVNGSTYVTDKKYRLPACVDEKAIPYEKEGTFTIYHLALENDNYYTNYGIYANGLLVETCSKRYLKEFSNMILI